MNKSRAIDTQNRLLLAAICCFCPAAIASAECRVPEPYVQAELKEHTRLSRIEIRYLQ